MKNLQSISRAYLVIFFLSISGSLSVLAAETVYAGTLTTAINGTINTMNPYSWGTTREKYVIDHLYGSLVRTDVNNQPQPDICTIWSYTSDYVTWTFTIPTDIIWHDGYPLTIADVYFTYSLLWTDDTLPRRSWLFDDITNLVIVGTNQIEITFGWGPKPADVLFDLATTKIVPMHIWTDVIDIYNFENMDPVGCGPFIFEEYLTGSYIKLSRYPDYHLTAPLIAEKIITINGNENLRYSELVSGNLEVLENPTFAQENLAASNPDIAKSSYLNDYIMYLGLNHRRYPMNITEFRQAVLHAINRSEIISDVDNGRGAIAPASMSLPYGPYYNPSVREYPYHVTLANVMLDDIGFLDNLGSDGIREDANGNDLSFDLIVSASETESLNTAIKIASFMTDIGIDITVKPVLFDVLWHEVGGDGSQLYDYEWCLLGWVGFWSDFHPSWVQWMFSKNLLWGSDAVNIPGWNGTARDLVSALSEEISAETDEITIKTKIDTAQGIIAQELPYLPIRIKGLVTLYRNDTFKNWQMGNAKGPDNLQTWLTLQLIDLPVVSEFSSIYQFVAISIAFGVFTISLKSRKKKYRF